MLVTAAPPLHAPVTRACKLAVHLRERVRVSGQWKSSHDGVGKLACTAGGLSVKCGVANHANIAHTRCTLRWKGTD